LQPDTGLNSKCLACGGQNWKVVSDTHGGDYLRCRHCRYHIRVATASERAEQFEAEQQRFYGDDTLCVTQLFNELHERRLKKRIDLVRRFIAQGRLIEVGPGNGQLLVRLNELGYQVTGAEHSETLSARIRDHGIDVKTGSFEEQSFDGEPYDAYLSFHVIEHVTDVHAHLQKAADIVRPGGYAFVATPNADSWEHRFSSFLSPNYSPVHLQLFSRKSLSLMMEKAGWTIEVVKTPSYTDAWLRVVSSFLRAVRGKRGGVGQTISRSDTPTRRAIIRTLGVVDWPLRMVQEGLKGGNELFVVARRR
jgi:2-polyprenyl-3-methyl-5-hydroxy-6-metoxy-1,4-benzoquinol methylase